MKKFTALSHRNIQMSEILSEFGWKGYGAFLAVYEWASEYGQTEVTESTIKQITRVNAVSASKYLPAFNRVLKLAVKGGK